jgi:DHA3 family macrolide efflux protein-like MFS transporter
MIPLIDGPIIAILQGTVEPAMQGRVFTIMGSLLLLTSPFSLAIAGPVSDWLGLQIWYLAAGVLCAGVTLTGFFVPAIVHIEENHKVYSAQGQKLAPSMAKGSVVAASPEVVAAGD